MRLLELACALRQLRYPREFRIWARETDAWAAPLADLLEHALRSSAALADEGKHEISVEVSVKLCNEYFRLKRNANQMDADGHSCKELRSIQRVLGHMEDLFQEHSIDCLDLTGQAYDDRRTDFEVIGEPQVDPRLKEKTVAFCERPAVMVKGKLVQRARVIVARPE